MRTLSERISLALDIDRALDRLDVTDAELAAMVADCGELATDWCDLTVEGKEALFEALGRLQGSQA